MPLFSFFRCDPEGRKRLARLDLPDIEAARWHAIELAEQILRAPGVGDRAATSRIEIVDATGQDLDTVISEAF